MSTPVIIPLLNPNEPEASLVSIDCEEGQWVEPGMLLATLETTKATSEMVAEQSGYITGLHSHPGDLVRAGEIFCYLVAQPGEIPEVTSDPLQGAQIHKVPSASSHNGLPSGLRISQPALEIARQRGINLTDLPTNVFITQKYLEDWANQHTGTQGNTPQVTPVQFEALAKIAISSGAPFNPKAIVVYGGGGHGKSVIELIRILNAYEIIGVVDDGLPAGAEILGVPVLGGQEVLPGLVQSGVRLAANAVGGIGNIQVRLKVFQIIAEHGLACPTLVHPHAFVEASAQLSQGAQVFPLAYIGSDARVGYGSIVNTGAIISHDCLLEDFTNISPGAILAGGVTIGSRTLVGMGVTVNLGVRVGENSRIGNGATVKSDVPQSSVVRAGAIFPA